MGFFENAEMVIALITGLFGLVGAAVSAYFAVSAWLSSLKSKSAQEIWGLIMDIADTAMEEAERTALSGADKKDMAIDIINTSALAAGLDITPFMNQLDNYIDQAIAFVNKMTKQ